MAHPPRSKPPLRSSSGPPNPCITPSTETLVVVVNLMSWSPPHVVVPPRTPSGSALLAKDKLIDLQGRRNSSFGNPKQPANTDKSRIMARPSSTGHYARFVGVSLDRKSVV